MSVCTLNALVVPHLNPYLEVGYGIGTHVFDFGVFASFANWKYQESGRQVYVRALQSVSRNREL